jgi:flagellar FliJ protein
MAKFNYRMQSILDIKIKMENQAKIAYGMANAKLAEEQKKLQEIMMRRAGYERRAKELVSGTINITEIRECKRAIDTMKSIQRSQMMNVHTAEKNVELARARLNEVMMERKTHEKLREKAFEEFKQEIAYQEGKEIDELVSYTYHNNSGEA